MDDAGVWQVLGLYDPGAPQAAERLALLRFLRDLGATDPELVEAHRVGRLAALAGTLVRRGERALAHPGGGRGAGRGRCGDRPPDLAGGRPATGARRLA